MKEKTRQTKNLQKELKVESRLHENNNSEERDLINLRAVMEEFEDYFDELDYAGYEDIEEILFTWIYANNPNNVVDDPDEIEYLSEFKGKTAEEMINRMDEEIALDERYGFSDKATKARFARILRDFYRKNLPEKRKPKFRESGKIHRRIKSLQEAMNQIQD
jgi:hypothetical protein